MGSWEDLDTFLARKHVSLLQTGGGQDELFQHPGSYLLQRQVDHHVSGKGLSRTGPEGSHSLRTPLTLGRSAHFYPTFFQTVPQRKRSLVELHILTSFEFFFPPIYKEQVNMRTYHLKNKAACLSTIL